MLSSSSNTDGRLKSSEILVDLSIAKCEAWQRLGTEIATAHLSAKQVFILLHTMLQINVQVLIKVILVIFN